MLERIWQFLGYALMQTNEAKAFFLMGEAPDSGKSLLGNFIEGLFDERYVSNIALNDFNRNFALAPIAGSAINISLDLPATQLKPSAVSWLKMLTGGDAFNINQKYVQEFRYRNRAKLRFATNFPIELLDNDDAFWRRMVYLPFDYSVPEAKRNPDLLELLQEEKDAIVSEALRHTKTLVENGFRFPITPQIERRLQEWQGKPSIRETTAAYYKNYIDKHIAPNIGKIKLNKLTTLDIQKFYNKAKTKGRVKRYEGMKDLSLSAKTIRGLHAMLRQCLDQAVQADLAACRRGDAELSTGQDLTRLTVPFLDNEFSLGLIFEGQADSAALFDLDGLALRVDDKSGRGLDLSDDHALIWNQHR